MVESQSWTNSFSTSFKNIHELYRYLNWELNPALETVAKTYPVFIPRRLAEKIKLQGPQSVLAR